MDTTDRVGEWRRLTETYRQMSDEELTHIAEEAYQLTDVAKQALQAEVNSRRLEAQLQLEAPEPEQQEPRFGEGDAYYEVNGVGEEIDPDAIGEGQFDADELDLVPAARVWDAAEARQTKSFLDDAGIPSYLGDDNVENVDEYTGSYEGGVDLKVRSADEQWAHRTLSVGRQRLAAETPDAEAANVVEDNREFGVRCPRCRETEVVFDGRNGEVKGNEAFHAKFKWHCPSCGHAWLDDGIEQPV